MTGHTPRILRVVTAVTATVILIPMTSAAAIHSADRPPPKDRSAGTEDISWTPELVRTGGDDVNVTSAQGTIRIRDQAKTFASIGKQAASGSITLAPRTLKASVNRLRATVKADVPQGASVTVHVRGQADQGWTEWHRAGSRNPAVFPQDVTKVQVRINLQASEDGPSPSVRQLRLTATSVPTTQRVQRSTPRTYSVFATREGLVGETTANGHVIEPRDHFVALPSGRALASNREGGYSVKVCSPNTGRCAFAPVWDKGPWNIHDDYWNPPSVRENWSDLPQGEPEAEAAYSDGYNGGKDGFGREVVNPAGIDLADGTFWDAVGLSDNGWVDVTYLWTGSYPATGTVATSGEPLRLRAGPTTGDAEVGMAGQHAKVPIYCQTQGETVNGYYGPTDIWNKVGPGMFISDSYTYTGSDGRVAPLC